MMKRSPASSIKRLSALKSDREDGHLDEHSMSVGQTLTGSGGWPLTIVMTPDGKKPFFAGTYFPRGETMGPPGSPGPRPKRIGEAWARTARRFFGRPTGSPPRSSGPNLDHEHRAVTSSPRTFWMKRSTCFERDFDQSRGGFGSAPKFPAPHNLIFLCGIGNGRGNGGALAMVKKNAWGNEVRRHLGSPGVWFSPLFD